MTPWIVELEIEMLLQLVPTAVPAFVTLPPLTWVQCPPVLPVIVVSAIVSVPPKSLLVKNKPPPKAFVPAAFPTIVSPHSVMFTELPSL